MKIRVKAYDLDNLANGGVRDVELETDNQRVVCEKIPSMFHIERVWVNPDNIVVEYVRERCNGQRIHFFEIERDPSFITHICRNCGIQIPHWLESIGLEL